MKVAFIEALKVWAKIGCLSFGGPAGQIALLHRELVDQRSWLSEKEFVTALNFCMLLPGPEAMQLATYSGWKLHGLKGGLCAGILFVVPGALVILALSIIYSRFGQLEWINALFIGVKAAVLAIVIEALLRVSKRTLIAKSDWWVAAGAFLALYAFALPFPLIIAVAGLCGYWQSRGKINVAGVASPSYVVLMKTLAIGLSLWFIPLALLTWGLGNDHVLAHLGLFFSKLAVVTFGGAYAVLTYMAQAAVEQKGWLNAFEMMDGLALAETTPGPLILVTQFVGYMAASRELAGSWGSIWGGIAGSVVTLWMTFVPCFLWIFAGAPFIDSLGNRPKLTGALHLITAAVVGVILNLSLWFGLNVCFGKVTRLTGWFKPWLPDWQSINLFSVALSILAALLLLRYHFGVIKTLGVCALIGGAASLIFQQG